jgi:dienelactone hydrolase
MCNWQITIKLNALISASVLFGIAANGSAEFSSFRARGEKYDALECRPKGDAPFPVVVYNHGSIVDAVGFAKARDLGNRLDEICSRLAADGFLAFFPIREKINTGRGYADYQPYYNDVVNAAIDHLKALSSVDKGKINLMGHSMGGLVSLLVAEERKDLRSLVVSAPASKNKEFGSSVYYASEINVPVLVMVERGDANHIQKGINDLEAAFKKHNKLATVIRYDRGGGHNLFFTVDYYWPDVAKFLKTNN